MTLIILAKKFSQIPAYKSLPPPSTTVLQTVEVINLDFFGVSSVANNYFL